MRVFAGPNGSGKSSIIKSVLNTRLKDGRKLDFGIYINADDIAAELLEKECELTKFEVQFSKKELLDLAKQSGLLNKKFTFERFSKCVIIEKDVVKVNHKNAKTKNDSPYERIAQIYSIHLGIREI